jgi:hypothetical protein
MQNEHRFQSSGHAEAEVTRQPREEKWAEFTRELEMLGHQISELSHRAMGDDLIQRVNAQYRTVRT